jgi:hypothetical protein
LDLILTGASKLTLYSAGQVVNSLTDSRSIPHLRPFPTGSQHRQSDLLDNEASRYRTPDDRYYQPRISSIRLTIYNIPSLIQPRAKPTKKPITSTSNIDDLINLTFGPIRRNPMNGLR